MAYRSPTDPEAARRAIRFDRRFFLLLLLLTALTRIPYASQMLFNHDSVVYAMAMENYNPRPLGAPHPPGYIFYIGLANLVQATLFSEANDALVSLSIVFELFTLLLLYQFCLEAFNRTAAVVSTLALLFSPLFWFHGEVALSYPIESFFGILVTLLLYRAASGSVKNLYAGAACIALAGGFRTFATIFLMPLLFYVILLYHRRVGRIAKVALIGIGCGLLWIVPSLIYGGGYEQQAHYSHHFWTRYLRSTSVFYGVPVARVFKQQVLIMETCFSALWLFALPLGLVLIRQGLTGWFQAANRLRRSGPTGLLRAGAGRLAAAARRNDPFLLLLVLIVPVILFLSLLHFSQRGHVFLFLPLLFIPIPFAIDALCPIKARKRWIAAITGLGLLVNCAAFFALAPVRTAMLTSEARNGLLQHYKFRLQNNLNHWILDSSRDAILHADRLRDDFDKIRGDTRLDPKHTVIVTKRDSRFRNLFTQSYFNPVRYYLDAYPCYEIRIGATRMQLADEDLSLDHPTLTFGPDDWNVPKKVVVSAATDADRFSGVAAFKIWTHGAIPETLIAREVEADGPTLKVWPDHLTVPKGGAAQFQVQLSQAPLRPVTVTVKKDVGGDPDLKTDTQRITLTPKNWQTPQTVTVRSDPSDHPLAGGSNFLIRADGFPTLVVTTQERSDRPADILLSSPMVQVKEGGSAFFTVRLRVKPDRPVTLRMDRVPGSVFYNELKLAHKREQTLLIPYSPAAKAVLLPAGTRRIIWFIADEILIRSTVPNPVPPEDLPKLRSGRRLVVSSIEPGESLFFGGYEFICPREPKPAAPKEPAR